MATVKPSKDYMIRLGVSSSLPEDKLEEALEDALDARGILSTIYEIMDDDDEFEFMLATRERKSA
jgi:hypothetical protein